MKKLILAALLLSASAAHADRVSELLRAIDKAAWEAKILKIEKYQEHCRNGFTSACSLLETELRELRRQIARLPREQSRQQEVPVQNTRVEQ